jgi:hypothetical protein
MLKPIIKDRIGIKQKEKKEKKMAWQCESTIDKKLYKERVSGRPKAINKC